MENQRLKTRLNEAIEVIRFYGTKENWIANNTVNYKQSINMTDMEEFSQGFYGFGGGKRARDFLRKQRENN